jgi:hypothetical protein
MIHESYQNKANRDKRAKQLEKAGYEVKLSVNSNQLMHPMYINDYGRKLSSSERGFGNTIYQTHFAKVYSLDAKPSEWEVVSKSGNRTVSKRIRRDAR